MSLEYWYAGDFIQLHGRQIKPDAWPKMYAQLAPDEELFIVIGFRAGYKALWIPDEDSLASSLNWQRSAEYNIFCYAARRTVLANGTVSPPNL